MDPQIWAFLLVATLLAVTPGADTLLVARNVLGRGRTDGLATIAGIATGCFVHATLSAVGVSLLLVRSAEAFAPTTWRRPPRRRIGTGRERGGCGPSWKACSPTC